MTGKGGGRQSTSLPAWMRDEDMLRRILGMRMAGAGMARIRAVCGIGRHQWDLLRRVARLSPHPGDREAAAFLERFDAMPRPRPQARAMFSADEGALLAESMRVWRIEPVALDEGDLEADER